MDEETMFRYRPVDLDRIIAWDYFLRTGDALSCCKLKIKDTKLEAAIHSARSIITESEKVVHRIKQREFFWEYYSLDTLSPEESANDALVNLGEITSDPVTLQTLVTLEGYKYVIEKFRI